MRGGPPPGDHNFFRGGPLTVYDGETRAAIAALGSEVDAGCATRAWEAALRATWRGTPVWVHGDIASGNLLVRGGRLHAVIDFGCSGVGDPAGDTAIAWTFLSGEARRVFRSLLPFDEATWARGRGWALWKALIVLVDALDNDPQDAILTKRVIDEVLAEHEACGAL